MEGKVYAKTYPLRTTNVWLDKVRDASKKAGYDSMKDFMEDAIEEKIKRTGEKEDAES